ncbi:hypothetical protein ECE50_002230 [Chitinophaga sp. Mgbs1]|uniref:Uncharacterized protein n=1 Tax=Chitinophaga solisilvae TaxID=1233460 RepID=A0A3S1AWI5_9BACT|nr:hypothetical protein [Chitinophaga solisilvae]
MTVINHETLLEYGFVFQQVKRSYRIDINGAAFGVVQKGDQWLASPIPMEFASLSNVESMEEVEEMIGSKLK